ncbi:bifunctional riboflavin kinase/FAD synthetase [Dermabacteraceae bacterium P13103]
MSTFSLWLDAADVTPQIPGSVVTIGNFDGVHRGHQHLLEQVLRRVEEADGDAEELWPVAVTFRPHPRHAMGPTGAPPLIYSYEQRNELLRFYGMRAVLELPFTREFAALTPEDFVRRYLVDALRAKVVVLGEDARFGRRNAGSVETMRELGEKYGFTTVVVEDLLDGHGQRYSSTRVREAVLEGDIALANELLGRPHSVSDTVHHGYKRGRELGFPTANLGSLPDGLIPADGVYAGLVTVTEPAPGCAERGDDIAGAPATISIGTNPTFETEGRPARTVEAYVHGRHDLDLYDSVIRIDFLAYQRPTLRFPSVESLVAQMAEDKAVTSRTIEELAPGLGGRA